MKKKFIDPLIKRKKKLTNNVNFYNNIPLPAVVEISESGTCNRKCSFCPRSAPDFKDIKEFISDKLFDKLILELSEFKYSGILLFSGFVEPLLDKNIYNLINKARNKLPNCRIEMVTNGDALNTERAKELFENGLSTLLISIYDGKKEADEMEKMLTKGNIPKEKYEIRHRYLSEDQNFGITLSNRAGMMENAEYKIKSLKEPMKQACYYPHYTFFMDYTGEVLICSHDWGKKLIVGNMNDDSFINIWTSELFMSARQELKSKNRNFAPCDKCDVNGVFMGKNHLEAWDNFLNKNEH